MFKFTVSPDPICSGSDLFDKKICIFCKFFFQFVFGYILISLETLKVVQKAHFVQLKFANYLVGLVQRVGRIRIRNNMKRRIPFWNRSSGSTALVQNHFEVSRLQCFRSGTSRIRTPEIGADLGINQRFRPGT